MNFDYSEEQQLLADSVRRYLANDYDFERARRSSPPTRAERPKSGRPSPRWA
jgi:hypothetical protein